MESNLSIWVNIVIVVKNKSLDESKALILVKVN